jgi:hypothetical protein
VLEWQDPAKNDRDIITVLDLSTGKKVNVIHRHSDRCLACSASGKLLASENIPTESTRLANGSYKIAIWNLANGKVAQLLRWPRDAQEATSAAAFSRDETILASAPISHDYQNYSVLMWNVNTGKQLHSLSGHTEMIRSLAFSPDGKVLASGSFDNTTKLWDVASGRLLRTLEGHQLAVDSVTFSPDGKTLATASDDRSVKLWDLKSGKEIATFVSAGKVDTSAYDSQYFYAKLTQPGWAVARNDGRFDTNNLEAIPLLAWNCDDQPTRAFPAEIFMRQYFEPNLLARSIKREALAEVPDITKLNRVQPEVEITKVCPNGSSKDLVEVTVCCKSVTQTQPNKLASGLYDLRLFRDGQLVGSLPGETPFYSAVPIDLSLNSEQQALSFSWLQFSFGTRADLSHGSPDPFTHTFTVKLPYNGAKSYSFSSYAFNCDKVKSQTASRDYQISKPLPPKRGRAYIIAFGVNESDDPQLKLNYAADDARSYIDELKPPLTASHRFTEVIPIRLISELTPNTNDHLPATKAALRAVLEKLAGRDPENARAAALLTKWGLQKAEPEDFVLMAFSCHGDTDVKTGEYYLIPSDIGNDQDQGWVSRLQQHAISSAELTDWLRDVDAGDMAMVIDSCHSAAVAGQDFKPGPMDSPGLGQLAYYKQMRILSAAKANRLAKENSHLQHGLLTYALLNEGLDQHQARASSDNGPLTLQQWLQFAVTEVPHLDKREEALRVSSAPKVAQSGNSAVTLSSKQKGAGFYTAVGEGVKQTDTDGRFQSPSLLNFSRNARDVIIMNK